LCDIYQLAVEDKLQINPYFFASFFDHPSMLLLGCS